MVRASFLEVIETVATIAVCWDSKGKLGGIGVGDGGFGVGVGGFHSGVLGDRAGCALRHVCGDFVALRCLFCFRRGGFSGFDVGAVMGFYRSLQRLPGA